MFGIYSKVRINRISTSNFAEAQNILSHDWLIKIKHAADQQSKQTYALQY